MPRSALLLLAIPIVAAACGGGTNAKATAASPVEAVKAAIKKTFAAGSESLAFKASAETGGQTVAFSGDGAFDTNKRAGTLRTRIDAGPLATSADEIIVGRSVYVKSDLLTAQLPSGKTWFRLDLGRLSRLTGGAQLLFPQDPAGALGQLRYLKSATKVGTDHAGTRYHAVLDVTKLPRAARSVSSYDVWVGDDGYVHRLQVASAKPKAGMTVDFSGFGRKVSATPPPAAQVYAGQIPGLGA